MNLLRVGWLKRLLKGAWFPLVPQGVMLVVLGLLIAGGLGIATTDAALSKELRNTNLANLIVWSYWWPVIIIAAIALGRLWCTVCPIELLSFGAGRYGLRREVPRWLRSGWGITIFYTLVLLVGVHTLEVHRVPHRMALYLLMLLALGGAVTFVYGKRGFCSHLCPVGYLLGLYATIAPLEWRADDAGVCKDCKTKDCVAQRNRYRLRGRSCTSNLYPATIADNRQCLICTQCLKACPNDNLRLSIRRPFADFFRSLDLRWAEIVFVLVVGGFVVYEILSEWAVSKAILTWVPNRMAGAVGATGPLASFLGAVVMFVIFPALLALLVALAARALAGVSPKISLQSLSLLLLPTMAAAHILKSLLKMNPRIPYWRGAFADPAGLTTAQNLVAGTLKLDKSIVAALDPIVTASAVVLLLAALAAVILIWTKAPVLRAADRRARAAVLAGAIFYWAIFAVTIAKWRL